MNENFEEKMQNTAEGGDRSQEMDVLRETLLALIAKHNADPNNRTINFGDFFGGKPEDEKKTPRLFSSCWDDDDDSTHNISLVYFKNNLHVPRHQENLSSEEAVASFAERLSKIPKKTDKTS